jgi:hyperosmotically inducible protein
MNLRHNVLLASIIGAAVAVGGCGNPSDNASARTEARTDRLASTTTPPPVIAPGDPASRAANAMDDTALTAKVKAALIAEPGLKAMPIDVSTNDAVVTLSGTVATADERAKAVQLAENVDGVRSVVDKLAMKSQG